VSYLRTSIVIDTKNAIATIDRCLSSLMPYYRQGYISEIVVVDGYSTDGTLEVIKGYPAKLLLEKGTAQIAVDAGWRHSQGEVVIFLNGDAYLEEGFFPRVHELFSDEKIGWISCGARAVVTNKLTKAQDEDWLWHIGLLNPSPSWFQRLYAGIASGGKPEPRCGGPCMIVRRTCLEASHGCQGLGLGALQGCGDICWSQRIADMGWKTTWWGDAPVYHYPKDTFKRLMKQLYNYGKSEAYMQMEREFAADYQWHQKVTGIIARLGSPALGLMLAIRFRNPLQLIIYPLPRYAWVIGYIAGWAGAKKRNDNHPNGNNRP
jgi:glycosyltransferase involved in cell wall biosynthesis